MVKFIFKANDDVLSHCRCADEPAMSSGQMDCPWCGCGWLISCSKCAKAFTYAVVKETDVPLEELGRRDAERRGLTSVTDQECEAWAARMAEAFEPFEVGDIVVYLDGEYWPLGTRNVRFEGYYATHDLVELPHAKALRDPNALRAILGAKSYWFERERPDRG